MVLQSQPCFIPASPLLAVATVVSDLLRRRLTAGAGAGVSVAGICPVLCAMFFHMKLQLKPPAVSEEVKQFEWSKDRVTKVLLEVLLIALLHRILIYHVMDLQVMTLLEQKICQQAHGFSEVEEEEEKLSLEVLDRSVGVWMGVSHVLGHSERDGGGIIGAAVMSPVPTATQALSPPQTRATATGGASISPHDCFRHWQVLQQDQACELSSLPSPMRRLFLFAWHRIRQVSTTSYLSHRHHHRNVQKRRIPRQKWSSHQSWTAKEGAHQRGQWKCPPVQRRGESRRVAVVIWLRGVRTCTKWSRHS
mgnify:FL=1